MTAILRAMSEMFGVQELPSVTVHGRTDRAILADLFGHFEIDLENNIDEFHRRYWIYLPEAMQQIEGTLLPGVLELLNVLSQRDDVALGLLTGNAKVPAYAKLTHFALADFFSFGGFGDIDDCRNRVAARAKSEAAKHLSQRFDPERVWVIGDTIHDVNCARTIGARVVALETGGTSAEKLALSRPDLIMSDLSDTNHFLDQVLS